MPLCISFCKQSQEESPQPFQYELERLATGAAQLLGSKTMFFFNKRGFSVIEYPHYLVRHNLCWKHPQSTRNGSDIHGQEEIPMPCSFIPEVPDNQIGEFGDPFDQPIQEVHRWKHIKWVAQCCPCNPVHKFTPHSPLSLTGTGAWRCPWQRLSSREPSARGGNPFQIIELKEHSSIPKNTCWKFIHVQHFLQHSFQKLPIHFKKIIRL